MFGSPPTEIYDLTVLGCKWGISESLLGDSDIQLELQAITLGSCYSRGALDVPSASPGSLLDVQSRSPPRSCWIWICTLRRLPGKLEAFSVLHSPILCIGIKINKIGIKSLGIKISLGCREAHSSENGSAFYVLGPQRWLNFNRYSQHCLIKSDCESPYLKLTHNCRLTILELTFSYWRKKSIKSSNHGDFQHLKAGMWWVSGQSTYSPLKSPHVGECFHIPDTMPVPAQALESDHKVTLWAVQNPAFAKARTMWTIKFK